MMDLNKIDKSKFINSPFLIKVEKPWGHELIFTQPDLPYTGKIISIKAGKRLSLQIHDEKQESCFLVSGECNLIIENTEGELETINMEAEKGYTIKKSQRHRFHSVTDCELFEVSTPEIGITYRLEDDYRRPDETQEFRTKERGLLD